MFEDYFRNSANISNIDTYWTFVRPGFFFANITALLRRDISIIDGFTLHASPSTCMGMVFDVTILAERHWVMHVPWPPACRRGCARREKNVYEDSLQLIISLFTHQLVRSKTNNLNQSIVGCWFILPAWFIPRMCSTTITRNIKENNRMHTQLFQFWRNILAITFKCNQLSKVLPFAF